MHYTGLVSLHPYPTPPINVNQASAEELNRKDLVRAWQYGGRTDLHCLNLTARSRILQIHKMVDAKGMAAELWFWCNGLLAARTDSVGSSPYYNAVGIPLPNFLPWWIQPQIKLYDRSQFQPEGAEVYYSPIVDHLWKPPSCQAFEHEQVIRSSVDLQKLNPQGTHRFIVSPDPKNPVYYMGTVSRMGYYSQDGDNFYNHQSRMQVETVPIISGPISSENVAQRPGLNYYWSTEIPVLPTYSCGPELIAQYMDKFKAESWLGRTVKTLEGLEDELDQFPKPIFDLIASSISVQKADDSAPEPAVNATEPASQR